MGSPSILSTRGGGPPRVSSPGRPPSLLCGKIVKPSLDHDYNTIACLRSRRRAFNCYCALATFVVIIQLLPISPGQHLPKISLF